MNDRELKKLKKHQQYGGDVLRVTPDQCVQTGNVISLEIPDARYYRLKTSRGKRIENLKAHVAIGGEIEWKHKGHPYKGWQSGSRMIMSTGHKSRKVIYQSETPKRTPEMKATLKRWRYIATLTEFGQFKPEDSPAVLRNCALCNKHAMGEVLNSRCCSTCDIALHTKTTECRSTPYYEARNEFMKLMCGKPNNWPEASAAEVKFLESVPYPGE